MTEPRLKTDLRVAAILRRENDAGNPAMRLRKGDEDAGGILVILRNKENLCLILSETRTIEGEPAWMKASGPEPITEEASATYIDRRVNQDPDLWVLEIETQSFIPASNFRII
ncbi:MAG: DUF1491 family protein [Acetobacter sp.]|nr:DUF1491 family protein [Acetobacter sp.]